MDIICKLYWHKNFTASALLDKVLEDEFMKRRSLAVDKLNDYYEKWNEEFDKLYPELDGTTQEYLEFISNKQQVILDTVNKRKIGMNLLKLKTDAKHQCDIYAVLRADESKEIYITIKVLDD